MSVEFIIYNTSVSIAGIILLQKGASLLVNNASTLLKQAGVPDTVLALLTAHAEYEELAVIVLSLVQGHPELAFGHIVGSNIANILAAFSIGLLEIRDYPRDFDRNSKLYTLIPFIFTGIVSALALSRSLTRAVGAVLVSLFLVYLAFVCWCAWNGERSGPGEFTPDFGARQYRVLFEEDLLHPGSEHYDSIVPTETTPFFHRDSQFRRLSTLVIGVVLGLAALVMSGFILSHSAVSLAKTFNISEVVFGATILAAATTVPEKSVAVASGSRGYGSTLIAKTVDSNIFLLTLCLGIVLLAFGPVDREATSPLQLYWMWATSAAFLFVVLIGTFRLFFGAVMLAAYVVFLALQLVVFRDWTQ